jgi:endogenous inhibitor of DNA gyrase (YacG/DUF329 family)
MEAVGYRDCSLVMPCPGCGATIEHSDEEVWTDGMTLDIACPGCGGEVTVEVEVYVAVRAGPVELHPTEVSDA